MNEVYEHLTNPKGPHHIYAEACKNCKQPVLSADDKVAHGDGFRRCTNTPFRRKGPEAVQAQWGALFRALEPGSYYNPSPCMHSAIKDEFIS
jgi:hypothetical protein